MTTQQPFTAQSTWEQIIDGLVDASDQGPEQYTARVEELDGAIKALATAHHQFGYLRFEPAHDAAMVLSDIAGVFTQDDYQDAVEHLFVSPARVRSRVTQELLGNPELAAVSDVANVTKFGKIALNSLVIELGDQPEDLPERLAQQEEQRKAARANQP